MSRKVMIELDYHPAILAAMCHHAWDDMEHQNCPTGCGLKCAFDNRIYCSDVTTQDWEAVCLAHEEKEDEDDQAF